MIYYGIFIALILQRLSELKINSSHLKDISHELINPINKREKNQMIILHALWFLSSLVEFFIHGKQLNNIPFLLLISLLTLFQVLRYFIIIQLGNFWTTFPVAFKNQVIYDKGPYRFLRHPNYLIVILEIFLYPLLGGCYYTSLLFGFLNLLFIVRRIKLEEDELMKIPDYMKAFKMKKKLIPFLFSFILISSTYGREMKIKSENFQQAKEAKSYFKFTGESTKLGFITTEFEGYAKEFKLSFEEKNGVLQDVNLVIKAKEIDTDNGSRNEKMWDLCLDQKKFPNLSITTTPIDPSLEVQDLEAKMNVRDQIISLSLKLKKISPSVFQGEGSFKLSEAKIPDPSIAIASVNDVFNITFQVDLTE